MRLSLCVIAAFASLCSAQASPVFTPLPTLPAQVNAAPSLLANIDNARAPDSQALCPGYTASNIKKTSTGYTADLTLAGKACNTYGQDIRDLSLLVEYQTQARLHVQIIPKYLDDKNSSHFFLPKYISGYPSVQNHYANDLLFEYTNSPTFQFRVSRASSREVIFSTYGKKIVYQSQFIELVTSMVPNYNVYGLPEGVGRFRLGTNFTRTLYNADAGNAIDRNIYGTHPIYLETRYKGSTPSLSHGVYCRNAHGQEWLLRTNTITYRALGGALDFYFLSGSTPQQVIAQYHNGIVGRPVQQQYWTLGFHQCRWGYTNWSQTEGVVNNYRKANIPLESIWNDIDYMDQYRDFTNSKQAFPLDGPNGARAFLGRLHANEQHYIPILDSNVYHPNPANATDAYGSFTRGETMNAFIRNGNSGLYIGDNWPGYSVWADWLVPQGFSYWAGEIVQWYKDIAFDGLWLDLGEASSFCVGSCGEGNLKNNPNHPPFRLPGDPGNIDYNYPEGFERTNSTEAASASSAAASQSSYNSAHPTPPVTTTTSTAINVPTGTARNLLYPPYVINNVFDGHSLRKSSISGNATHNDPSRSVEYDFHNVWGHMGLNATMNGLLRLFPTKRPFVLGRSTFAGSGKYAAHWGGDNTSKWGSMYYSISQALQFSIAGIPMFGVDTCGFAGNSDFELCTRWQELSAFFSFYRNHNVYAAISQEAYVWASTAEATRRAIQVRYSLLPYWYTLFQLAHTAGLTVMRAVQWEFPNDESLAGVETQFMIGPSILVTPVLVPGATTVQGVFPGVAVGTVWYDWYTLQRVNARAGQNMTLQAPLEHINVHVRGGSILATQQPGYTTAATRRGDWSILVALDGNKAAAGFVYLDDGETIDTTDTRNVGFGFVNKKLYVGALGGYRGQNTPLANVTIAGQQERPSDVLFNGRSLVRNCNGQSVPKGAKVAWDTDNVLRISGLQSLTQGGAFARGFTVEVVTGKAGNC